MSTTRLLADIQSPWNHFARRFIDAPVFRLCAPFAPHPLANFWKLELKQDNTSYFIESNQPVFDTVEVWPKLHGRSWIFANVTEYDRTLQWTLVNRSLGAFPGTGCWGKFVKAPDWEDHEEAPLDYAASAKRNLEWFESLEHHPSATYREKGMPAWWWHAAEGGDPVKGPFLPGAFPALGSQGIRVMLLAAKLWPDRAQNYQQSARAMGDWLLRNHTPMNGPLGGLPYSSMREGKFSYSVDGDAINVSRSALPGMMMLVLYRNTGDEKYLDYAKHIALTIQKFIRPDGSMPYRVSAGTGEVVEDYTCGHLFVANFLETLNQVAPDERWPESAKRIVRWALEKPMKDFHWKGCYEDVGESRPFANLTGMDALVGVRLFCQHGQVAEARKLFRWVEDQFVNYGDELTQKCPTFNPCVREQWLCDFPMEGHTANYVSSCFALHKATGDAMYRRKGIAGLNAIVRAQRADGAYSTWGVDRNTGFRFIGYGGEGTWFNANHGATGALCQFLLDEHGRTA